ncbi:MAG: CBS domain-containing protein [Clostridia bacterium]|jgi:predicted transcriptional regulator|nr:CBS domain-containing protein [Spirochaetia bacterium]
MKKNHADAITAKSLMHKKYPVLHAGQTIQEALELLSTQESTKTVLVTDADGLPLGCLNAEQLLLHLLDGSIDELDSGEMPSGFAAKLSTPVAQLELEKLVRLAPDDKLAIMLLRAREGSSEWLLVCDGEKTLGQVSMNDLYLAAASLALAGGTADLPFQKH